MSVEVRFCVRWENRVDAQIHITMYKHARSVMFRLVKQVVVGRFNSRGVVPAIRKLLCGVFTVRGTAERRSHTELHV